MNIQTRIPRPATVSEATADFEDHSVESGAEFRFTIAQDVAAIQAMAETMARCARELAPLFASLDSPAQATPRDAFTADEVDAYAMVEALFWNKLSGPAETLLKTMLGAELKRDAKPVVEASAYVRDFGQLVPSFDAGCSQ